MKIALLGYGKMGKEIERIAVESGHEIILKIDSSSSTDLSTTKLSKADVAIEFSRPDAVMENIRKCFDAKVPVVVGTTGWNDRMDEVKTLCAEKKGSLIYGSNFSIGVNLFFELNARLAALMQNQMQYDVKMEEIHHLQKLDKPSGTAITLAKQIISEFKKKKSWALAEEKKNDEQLSIQSIRKENVVGTHVVTYFSPIDEIEIKHTAHSRKGFAEGAIKAAEWIKDKKGFYELRDMLNF